MISTPADKAQCHTVLDLGIPVVNPEFILTGILRQEADIKTYPFSSKQLSYVINSFLPSVLLCQVLSGSVRLL